MSSLPIYYLYLDYGKAGRESVIDYERCFKSDVIDDILTNNYQGALLGVHCIDRDEGRWTDVSEDIAREIMDDLDFEPEGDLAEFLCREVGYTNRLEAAE